MHQRHLAIEVAALEQFVQTRELGHRTAFDSWERHRMEGRANCTRAEIGRSLLNSRCVSEQNRGRAG